MKFRTEHKNLPEEGEPPNVELMRRHDFNSSFSDHHSSLNSRFRRSRPTICSVRSYDQRHRFNEIVTRFGSSKFKPIRVLSNVSSRKVKSEMIAPTIASRL